MKKNHVVQTLLVVLFATTISCNKVEKAPTDEPKVTFDITTAKAEIEIASQEFVMAMNKRDSIALANCYTKEAKFMQPNAKTVSGKNNIKNTFGQWFKNEMPAFSMKTIEIWGNENSITAEEEWTFTDKTGKVVDSGKSLELFIKEEGKWKMHRDCYNSDMPCPK